MKTRGVSRRFVPPLGRFCDLDFNRSNYCRNVWQTGAQMGYKNRNGPAIPSRHVTGLMRICLFEPDIPQNTGTILRMAACFGLPVDIIEPCGFLLTSGALKRAGMDYLEKADYIRHADWRAFVEAREDGTVPGRLVLLTTKGAEPYCDFEFRADDILMLGSESKGVPDQVHDYVDARVVIPMQPQMRSLNVAMATAMTLGEALRQTNSFPKRVE
tara:strand:- start:12645 stop:13286 length:642 start_codon:yes stop_codon:yes gene_type:complete